MCFVCCWILLVLLWGFWGFFLFVCGLFFWFFGRLFFGWLVWFVVFGWFVFLRERKQACEIACKYLKLHDTRSELHIQGITRSYH